MSPSASCMPSSRRAELSPTWSLGRRRSVITPRSSRAASPLFLPLSSSAGVRLLPQPGRYEWTAQGVVEPPGRCRRKRLVSERSKAAIASDAAMNTQKTQLTSKTNSATSVAAVQMITAICRCRLVQATCQPAYRLLPQPGGFEGLPPRLGGHRQDRSLGDMQEAAGHAPQQNTRIAVQLWQRRAYEASCAVGVAAGGRGVGR
jgi:hypothetical protein